MSAKTYYVPPTIEEKKSNLDAAGVSEAMKEMTGSDGMIHVELERAVTIEKLARDLYKDPLAGIREYVNNEARPCRTAIKKGYDASIHVTIDYQNKRVVIEGRGSMGMTMQTFRDVYTVLGRSGNFDGDESGQFGFGRASYLCLSDVVVFETWSRETGERFGFIGKGGKVYEPISEELLSINEYGTKVTMTVRKDIDMCDLVEYTKEISRFLAVPVFLNLPSPVFGKHWEDTAKYESGMAQIGPVSVEDFLLGDKDDGEYKFVKIDNDDYSFTGYVGSGWRSQRATCLIGIPIDMGNLKLGGFKSYVLNVKNERKYMPTASRDSLSNESTAMINDKLLRDIAGRFAAIKLESLDDYRKSSDKVLIKHARYVRTDGIPRRILIFSNLMDKTFRVIDADKDGVSSHEQFVDIVDKYEKLYFTRVLDWIKIKEFLKIEPDAAVISPTGLKAEKDDKINCLRLFGMETLAEHVRSEKIKMLKGQDSVITMHSGGLKKFSKKCKISDMDESCLRLPADMPLYAALQPLRNKSFADMFFVKDSKMMQTTRCVTLDAFCKKVERAKYDTSEGTMTGRQILKNPRLKIRFFDRNDTKFPGILSLQKCKELSGVDIVVGEKREKNSEISNRDKLKLAYKARHPTEEIAGDRNAWGDSATNFEIIGDSLDDTVKHEMTVEKLGIDINGSWNTNPDEAIKHIGQVRNLPIRELYARTCKRLFAWRDLWDSDDKDNRRNMAELHDALLKIDESADGKTVVEICRDVIKAAGPDIENVKKRQKIKYNITETAFDCIVKEYETIKDFDSRLDKTLNAMMKGAISGKIHAKRTTTAKSEYDDKKAIRVTLDVQPIDLHENCLLLRTIMAISNRYTCALASVKITDKNKMEITM